ncbi:hypothetical protein [Pseudonocardia sp.]|jgi:hypothetical protein|uniref:hypothetical protein n=1 Tax=Pseudonocardia sp. TaxID=60912 RepID=UPI003D0F5057
MYTSAVRGRQDSTGVGLGGCGCARLSQSPPAVGAGNVLARFAETAAGMRIDRGNVLTLAVVLTAEATRLQRPLNDDGKQRLGLRGGDPRGATKAFDHRVCGLIGPAQLELLGVEVGKPISGGAAPRLVVLPVACLGSGRRLLPGRRAAEH